MSGVEILLEVRGLKKHFPVRRGAFGFSRSVVRAVEGVSFSVGRGRTLGLVGESGCGKTTVGRTILRLLEPTAGEIFFRGVPIHSMRGSELRPLRRHMQAIFQDPYGSLNPRMTVGSIVGEPLAVHGVAHGRQRRIIVGELLERVGLSASYVNHYPHEFSGGQRQRIGIARALALNPDFIMCDEPVSALDVSIQAQIVNLLVDLQRERGISYLFISHDLAVVEHIAHEVAVMYMGRIVEMAEASRLYAEPLHPYTQALLAAIPVPDPQKARQAKALRANLVLAPAAAEGCSFHPRCQAAQEACQRSVPELREAKPGHWVRCFRV